MHHLEQLGPFFPGGRAGFLLIHGLAGTPAEMKIVGKRLNKYGFTVLCPQLAGHCASEAELAASSWIDWAKSALDAFDQLSEHMDAVFVGGLSAGAVLSLYLAECRPEKVRGLALYSITLRYDGWTIPKLRFLLPLVLHLPYIGKRYRFEEAFPYGIMNDSLRNRILTQMRGGDASAAGFTATPGVSVRELLGLVETVKKELPGVSTPTLLMHAKNDDIASLWNARYVQEHVNGPAELLLLENSYHMITVDQERKKVCDATARFAWNLLSPEEKRDLSGCAAENIPETEKAGRADGDGRETFSGAAGHIPTASQAC
ncbi:MAG: alpha/beta fold hydrolase [Deltaproteobacteria bacterium]|jgi:carboxylesterase|nr:alpha/beta fold hydrolase [Deltaproteobacteria bacterium]